MRESGYYVVTSKYKMMIMDEDKARGERIYDGGCMREICF